MLEVNHLSKDYLTPQGPLRILSDISLALSRGQAAAVMGPSGSGKSTLLHILGALDFPTAGTVTLDGRNPFQLRERELAAFHAWLNVTGNGGRSPPLNKRNFLLLQEVYCASLIRRY